MFDWTLESQSWSFGRPASRNDKRDLHPPWHHCIPYALWKDGPGSERKIFPFDSPHAQGHTQREVPKSDRDRREQEVGHRTA